MSADLRTVLVRTVAEKRAVIRSQLRELRRSSASGTAPALWCVGAASSRGQISRPRSLRPWRCLMLDDLLTRARALLAQRRAASDLEAVTVLADLIAEVERLTPVDGSRRLVWVRDDPWAGWHLCLPSDCTPRAACYTVWERSGVAFARTGKIRQAHIPNPAARLALLVMWAVADGYDPDPWPGEAMP